MRSLLAWRAGLMPSAHTWRTSIQGDHGLLTENGGLASGSLALVSARKSIQPFERVGFRSPAFEPGYSPRPFLVRPAYSRYL